MADHTLLNLARTTTFTVVIVSPALECHKAKYYADQPSLEILVLPLPLHYHAEILNSSPRLLING